MPPRDFLDQGRIRLHERGTIALDDDLALDWTVQKRQLGFG
jgi:hypothetical protein